MSNDTNLEHPPPAGTDQQPPEGGSGETRPPLRRFDGILGGVSGGLAHYLGVAPWLVRLGFVVLTFFGGLGVLLYLAGWLLIPAEGADEAVAERWLEQLGTGPSWIGAVLIALAAIWIVTSLEIAGSGLAWAVALLILGVLLYKGEIPRREQAPGAGSEGPEAGAATPVGAEVGETPPPVTPPAARRTRQPRPRREPRPRSMLGRFTLAAGLIGIGIFALLDNAGVIFPDARHYLALTVAIAGVGLLVGSVWGRSRMLIVAGLVLTFLMGVAAIGDAVDTFTDDVRTFAPATVSEIAPNYDMDTGTLIIDLSGIEWESEDVTFDAELGAGQLKVILPTEPSARISARAGVGRVAVFGRSSEGLGVGRTVTYAGVPGSGDISIDLRVGAGEIIVTQESN